MTDTSIYRVTMRLTQNDVDSTEALAAALNSRSKAEAISQAIAIARMIVDSMRRGEEVLLRKPGSEVGERIVIPGLRPSSDHTVAAAGGRAA